MNFVQDEKLIADAKELGFADGELATMKIDVTVELVINKTGYTCQQLREWLWEKHFILISINSCVTNWTQWYPCVALNYSERPNHRSQDISANEYQYFDNPFDAELDGVRRAIEYLKEKK